MILRIWRTFWRAFWAGYERGRRQAQERREADIERLVIAPLREAQRRAPTRADAERELHAAMTRYGLTDRDRRPQAGKES